LACECTPSSIAPAWGLPRALHIRHRALNCGGGQSRKSRLQVRSRALGVFICKMEINAWLYDIVTSCTRGFTVQIECVPEVMGLDDDPLPHSYESEHPPIDAPDGAIDLYPNKKGPRILHLPDRNQILTTGRRCEDVRSRSRAITCMRNVCPVPQVLESNVKDCCGYI
jgi:hypothetical protein